jgi:hypothetical protein
MENYKDSVTVKRNLLKYQTAIQARFGDKFEFVDMIVGGKSEYSKKVDFSAPITNLYAGFDKINEDFYNRNIGGVILISDGNFNEGSITSAHQHYFSNYIFKIKQISNKFGKFK